MFCRNACFCIHTGKGQASILCCRTSVFIVVTVSVDFNASEDNSVETVGYEDDFESDDECNDDEGKMMRNCLTEIIFCN